MKHSPWFVLEMSVLMLMAGAVAGCKRGSAAMEPPRQTGTENVDPNVFVMEHPEQFPVVEAATRYLPVELLVNGVVGPDISRTVPVDALAGGRAVEIRAKLGDDVTEGQVLVRILSPDLQTALSDYRKARADEVLARRAFERAELLHSRGALARKELEQAEDTYQKAKVDVETAENRIRVLGGNKDSGSAVIEVKAPASGTIVEQNVTGGAGVKSLDNSPHLFTIADLTRVWVLCDVYENNLAQVRLGDRAEVRLNAYPDRALRGRVSNISKILDPTTRSAKVRIELENRDGLLRPGMFATARFVSQAPRGSILVPASALLRLHDKDWVFRREGDGKFVRREVQAGAAAGDGWQQVLSGLRAGDRVVVKALEFSTAAEERQAP